MSAIFEYQFQLARTNTFQLLLHQISIFKHPTLFRNDEEIAPVAPLDAMLLI